LTNKVFSFNQLDMNKKKTHRKIKKVTIRFQRPEELKKSLKEIAREGEQFLTQQIVFFLKQCIKNYSPGG